jgi:hypothetical protein
MFKPHYYRAKATAYGNLREASTSPAQSREIEELEGRFAALADNEQALADGYDDALQVAAHDRPHDAVLAAEEEHVLRCLGAAVILQWNTLSKPLQREIFDTAGSVGKLLETEVLRGQIARFLHKHKNDARLK